MAANLTTYGPSGGVAFSTKKAANQDNLSTGGYAYVTWGTERYDIGGNVSGNSFTAPVTGKYLLTASVQVNQIQTNATYLDLRLYTSNRLYQTFISDPTVIGTYDSMRNTFLVDMDASDVANVALYIEAGTAGTDLASGDNAGFFAGCLVA